MFKEHALGLPPPQPSPLQTPAAMSYTQSLIARFNIPSARPAFSAPSMGGAASTATDFYTLLGSAVTAATSAGLRSSPSDQDGTTRDLSNSGTLIPPSISSSDRMSFIAAQRERLSILLSALDKEAFTLQAEDVVQKISPGRVPGMHLDGSTEADSETSLQRPLSAMSGLSKSRSEADFERIDKDVPEERPAHLERSGSWLPWSWGKKTAEPLLKVDDDDMSGIETGKAQSSGVEI